MVLVGNLAVRSGKKIDWDMQNMEARRLPEVKSMLKRVYRAGESRNSPEHFGSSLLKEPSAGTSY